MEQMEHLDDKALAQLSTAALIQRAHGCSDEPYWDCIRCLHLRSGEEVFRAAESLAASKDAVEREMGADILGQLGADRQDWNEESVTILIRLLGDEEADVVASAAFALGHRDGGRAIPALLSLVEHPEGRVRFGVVCGLTYQEDEAAIAALIQLSQDADFDTRNWATFALGSGCEVDTPELRAALHLRLADEEAEIRGEALCGLALRGDTSIKEALKRELAGEFHGIWAAEACAAVPDREYLPLLERLLGSEAMAENHHFEEQVRESIAACREAGEG